MMSLQILFAALLFVSGEASKSSNFKRSRSIQHREEPAAPAAAPEKKEEIPVDGSALSADVKAVTYKSKPVAAPDQGFEGADVAHAHMKTTTGDWGAEYGPEALWIHPAPKGGAAHNFISVALIAG